MSTEEAQKIWSQPEKQIQDLNCPEKQQETTETEAHDTEWPAGRLKVPVQAGVLTQFH